MERDIGQALCGTELRREVPEWVQLLPLGQVTPRPHDGRAPWTLTDAQAVVAATREIGQDLVIDYEHQTDLAERNGQPAPAAGWIKELAVRDGGIWGRVEWTERARAMIAAGEYRFLSPVFQFDRVTRRVKRLLRAGLTNAPALTLTALAKHEGNPMKTLIEQLRELLKLGQDADETAIASAVKTAIDNAAAASQTATALATVAKAVGLNEDASVEAIAAAAANLQKGGGADPTKFVKIEDFERVSTALAKLQGEVAAEKAEAAADAAIKAGKIVPAQRDWAIDFCKADPERFKAFVEKQPVIVQPGAGGAPGSGAGKPPSAKGAELDEEDLAVCRMFGMKPEDFKKARDEEEAA